MSSKKKTRKLPKVVTVGISVTCCECDARAVEASLDTWFCHHDVSLVQDKGQGVTTGKPRKMAAWMAETLDPFGDDK